MSINELRADYLLDKYIYSKDFHGLSSGFPNGFIPGLLFFSSFILVLLIIRKFLSFRKSFKEQSILLELTPPAMTEKTAYTTQQLFSVIHNLGKQRSVIDKVLGKKTLFTCEIVSTQNQGIRYLIRTTPDLVNNLKRSLISYMPQVNVKTVNEYLPEKMESYQAKVIEFNQTKHFAYPLEKQNILIEHDPVAYITGMMTKLSPGELISLQIVLTPTEKKVTSFIKHKILRGEDVLGYINQLNGSVIANILVLPLKTLQVLLGIVGYILRTVITDFADAKMAQRQAQGQYLAYYATQNLQKPARVLTNFEQEIVKSIEGKIDQSLFEAKIRILIGVKDRNELTERVRGFTSSFGIFSATSNQTLKKKLHLPLEPINKSLMLSFQKRLLSLVFNSSPTILSISEVSDLYHFPFTRVTQTENIIKAHSKELPAPVSLKKGRVMDSVFGVNTYGGTSTEIGLTEEERQTHMYILGRTGSGKTTLMFTMAKHDIETGKGLVFIDPHGDVSEDLVASVPLRRKDDLIYVNPTDLKHPIGINLLELTPGLDEDEAELEKEVVAEGMVSLFRKVFSKEENSNAHRIEYILRNTIYTAFTTEGCTIFTINKILTNPTFRKQVVSRLKDPDLVDFWKYEFGKAGDYQVVKMTQGVTAKVGRFLRSPTARRILEQEKSTINFDDIINHGKILICNFSQKLGEDTSRLLGTTIMTKLQQAALKRAYIPENERKTFYLYVDEFQNFATQSFTKMVTEGRKYRMPLIIAEQSTSQQKDRDITNIILANVTTVVSFRSGNYIDEDLMLNQFAPYLEKGEIMNLPRYKFYIKISAIESEEPFSGSTLYSPVVKDAKKIEQLIEASRKNWAIDYKKNIASEVITKVIEDVLPKASIKSEQTKKRNGFPESKNI